MPLSARLLKMARRLSTSTYVNWTFNVRWGRPRRSVGARSPTMSIFTNCQRSTIRSHVPVHRRARFLPERPESAGVLHPRDQGRLNLPAYEPQCDPVGLLSRGGLRGQPQAHCAPLFRAVPDSDYEIFDQTLD